MLDEFDAGGEPRPEALEPRPPSYLADVFVDERERDLLREVAADHERLRLTLAPGDPPLETRLLRFYDGQLLVDRLDPQHRVADLHVGDWLTATFFGRARNGFHEFRTQFRGRLDHLRLNYLLTWPAEIRRIQRRQAFRVIPALTLPAACVSFAGRPADEIIVENISMSGAALSFRRKVQLRVGMRLPKIVLVLDGRFTLKLDATLRGTWQGRGGRMVLGVQWEPLDPRDEQNLSNYINDCQRIQLRNRQRLGL